jgi:hypothetical protein
MKSIKFTCLFVFVLFCLPSVSLNAQSDAHEYLLAHYLFDGNLEDALGFFHGTTIGADPPPDPVFIQGHDGTPNGAIEFGDVNGYMINVGVFNPAAEGEADEQTVTFWAYWYGPTGRSQDIINKRTNYQPAEMMWGINQHADTDHRLSVRRRDQEGPADSEKGIPDSVWTHVAITFNGEEVEFYMDGEHYQTMPYLYGTGFDAAVNMGSAQDQDGSLRSQDMYNGALDDVRFYSRILTAEEILKIKEGTLGIADRSSNEGIICRNYPNPFNGTTTIKYSLPGNTRTEIIVYDLLGHKLTTLVDEYRVAGTHQVAWDASGLPAGVYVYQLKTDDFVVSKKMKLIR